MKYLLLIFAISLLFTAIFGFGLQKRREIGDLLSYFSLLFLATWALGLWFAPGKLFFWGAAWLTFLAIALFFSLFLLAFSTSLLKPRTRIEAVQKIEAGKQVRFASSAFFWVLMVGFSVMILVKYLTNNLEIPLN